MDTTAPFKWTLPQRAEIRKARQALARLIPHFDSAKKCGLDCTERELMREELDRALGEMEEQYGTA